MSDPRIVSASFHYDHKNNIEDDQGLYCPWVIDIHASSEEAAQDLAEAIDASPVLHRFSRSGSSISLLVDVKDLLPAVQNDKLTKDIYDAAFATMRREREEPQQIGAQEILSTTFYPSMDKNRPTQWKAFIAASDPQALAAELDQIPEIEVALEGEIPAVSIRVDAPNLLPLTQRHPIMKEIWHNALSVLSEHEAQQLDIIPAPHKVTFFAYDPLMTDEQQDPLWDIAIESDSQTSQFAIIDELKKIFGDNIELTDTGEGVTHFAITDEQLFVLTLQSDLFDQLLTPMLDAYNQQAFPDVFAPESKQQNPYLEQHMLSRMLLRASERTKASISFDDTGQTRTYHIIGDQPFLSLLNRTKEFIHEQNPIYTDQPDLLRVMQIETGKIDITFNLSSKETPLLHLMEQTLNHICSNQIS